MMRRLVRILSGISFRLLLFNTLIVFLPVAAILYLGTYERQLLQALEHAMVQQGRVLSAALSSEPNLNEKEAAALVLRMEQRSEARIRIIGTEGELLADSSLLGPKADAAEYATPVQEKQGRTPAEDRVLYQVASRPILAVSRILQPPSQPIESAEFYVGAERVLGDEVKSALDGRYGAATRISSGGQRSVTLYSAIPIRHEQNVIGVVLVSQSTYRILRDLYELRLEILKIFLFSLAAAIALSIVTSLTISIPLRKLGRQARQILDHRGRLLGSIDSSKAQDEIGDLSRSLGEMTQKLRGHLDFVESFAADVSHEFRNPLASIRTAAEMIAETDDANQRRHFVGIVQSEVGRMQNLLSAVKDISMLDAGMDDERRDEVDLVATLKQVIQSTGETPHCRINLEDNGLSLIVKVQQHRLFQVFQNLLENAVSFGSNVHIRIQQYEAAAQVTIEDDGPGIPEGHIGKIFDRFFTYRNTETGHMGLGLSIVKAIVEGYGGSVSAMNAASGGSVFTVNLPLFYQ